MNKKSRIRQHLLSLLTIRIDEIREGIALLKESRDNESKSSAGDKYETGRAMAQMELDKLEQQLQLQLLLQAEVLKTDPEMQTDRVGFGSLVNCSNGCYFIAVGLGKLSLEQEHIYAISLASPIGQALKGAKAGDAISFNGNTIQIISIE